MLKSIGQRGTDKHSAVWEFLWELPAGLPRKIMDILITSNINNNNNNHYYNDNCYDYN